MPPNISYGRGPGRGGSVVDSPHTRLTMIVPRKLLADFKEIARVRERTVSAEVRKFFAEEIARERETRRIEAERAKLKHPVNGRKKGRAKDTQVVQMRARNARIFAEHKRGDALTDIAKRYGVSRQRVHQVIQDELRRKDRERVARSLKKKAA